MCGKCSQILNPGTDVEIDSNSPRISWGTFGLQIVSIEMARPAVIEDQDAGPNLPPKHRPLRKRHPAYGRLAPPAPRGPRSGCRDSALNFRSALAAKPRGGSSCRYLRIMSGDHPAWHIQQRHSGGQTTSGTGRVLCALHSPPRHPPLQGRNPPTETWEAEPRIRCDRLIRCNSLGENCGPSYNASAAHRSRLGPARETNALALLCSPSIERSPQGGARNRSDRTTWNTAP